MFPENRIFRRTDSDFPTTKAVQERLRRAGRIDDGDEAIKTNAAPPGVPLPVRVEIVQPPPDSILIGDRAGAPRAPRQPVYMSLPRLMAGRCLIQGSSGAGKSYALRRVIEQAYHHVAVIVVDPEGEFAGLAEFINATTIRASEIATDGLTAAALAVRCHRVSVHFDLTDLEPDQRIAKAAAFFAGLLAAPREHWSNTVLVAIDEAHLLAPHVAASSRDAEIRRLGVATLTDLCARGRKRGLAPVIATQRLAKLAASVVSELHNFLLGLNIFDRDVARAADLLGYSYDKAATMRDLKPGEFYALGPALSSLPQLLSIAPTDTHHVGVTPDLKRAAAIAPEEARALLQLDSIREITPGLRATNTPSGQRLLDAFVLDPAAADAMRVIAALARISPNATTAAELMGALCADRAPVDQAIDLLARHGLIDTIPRADARIARLSTRLRLKLSDAQVVGLA